MTDKEIKTIYFHNKCGNESSFLIIKQKNIVDIHNNMIKKNETVFPLDSSESVLKRDIKNNEVFKAINAKRRLYFMSILSQH